MIIFNDKKYAANESEFTNSLFSTGGTCNGFYKRMKNGFRLFNLQNELIAFVRLSFEPMLMSATKQEDSKIWYSYTNSKTEEYLGFFGSLVKEKEAVIILKDNYFN